MSLQQDWVKRQVEDLVRLLARVIFHKDTIQYEIDDESNLTETDTLYKEILKLVENHEICKAEDIIYEELDLSNEKDIELALDFYQTINRFSDEELDSFNFSRDEVTEGLDHVAKLLKIQL